MHHKNKTKIETVWSKLPGWLVLFLECISAAGLLIVGAVYIVSNWSELAGSLNGYFNP